METKGWQPEVSQQVAVLKPMKKKFPLNQEKTSILLSSFSITTIVLRPGASAVKLSVQKPALFSLNERALRPPDLFLTKKNALSGTTQKDRHTGID